MSCCCFVFKCDSWFNLFVMYLQVAARNEILASGGSVSHHHGSKSPWHRLVSTALANASLNGGNSKAEVMCTHAAPGLIALPH